MALAAHEVAPGISSDDVTYTCPDGINDVSFGPNREMLETTDFCDTSGAKTRLAGLLDTSVSLSGDYESADTAQALLRSSFLAGTAVYARFLWDGATGHKVQCLVESYEITASVDGKVEFSASLTAIAAPVAV